MYKDHRLEGVFFFGGGGRILFTLPFNISILPFPFFVAVRWRLWAELWAQCPHIATRHRSFDWRVDGGGGGTRFSLKKYTRNYHDDVIHFRFSYCNRKESAIICYQRSSTHARLVSGNGTICWLPRTEVILKCTEPYFIHFHFLTYLWKNRFV